MKKPLINVADAETHTETYGERFEYPRTSRDLCKYAEAAPHSWVASQWPFQTC